MQHQSVLLKPAIDYLQVKPKAVYLDATFGAGGHSREIISRGGKVIAFEYDQATYHQAQLNFAHEIAVGELTIINKNFANLNQALENAGKKNLTFAGAIFDLGTSSDQLMSGEKGLSVYQDGPLDMRLDSQLAVSAYDLLQVLSAKQLAQAFWELGGEKESQKIAKAIKAVVKEQKRAAFLRSAQLSQLISKIKKQATHLHPATKVFQALRILVNGEIESLSSALPQVWEKLQIGARLVTLAFHQGEDKPIKHFLCHLAKQHRAILLLKKPLQSTEQEIKKNPRSRSVKMRVGEKIK